MKNKLALFVCFLSLFASCKVPKDVTYFQGIDDLSAEELKTMSQEYSTAICEDDLLTITVTAWDPIAVTPFNPPLHSFASEGETYMNSGQQLHTYLVDKDGYINFPVIGRTKASGLSKRELGDNLQKKIANYVKDPIVDIQIVNFRITLMGEIARIGRYVIPNNRISIIDAIGQAGDLTINANRKNILIIRTNDGVPEYGRVDLTDPAIFTSPYYYLRQNDVVYIEPNDAKKRNANYSSAQQYSITVFSAILSTVSLITTSVIALTQ